MGAPENIPENLRNAYLNKYPSKKHKFLIYVYFLNRRRNIGFSSSNSQANSQANRQANSQANSQANIQANSQACQSNRQAKRLEKDQETQ